jgi:hypothetical protein
MTGNIGEGDARRGPDKLHRAGLIRGLNAGILNPTEQLAERRLSVECERKYRRITAAIPQDHGLLAGETGQKSSEGSQKKCIPAYCELSAGLEKVIHSVTGNLAGGLSQRNGCRAGPAI